MAETPAVRVERNAPVTTVILSRPDVRNAVDRPTAAALADAFLAFERDPEALVAVFWGEHGTFCAGADLKAVSAASAELAAAARGNRVGEPATGAAWDPLTTDGPMGPSRMLLSKPVIAAVSGHAVAGGLELALWCDMRVAASDAVFGVFCRRWGVPLIDGGTVRLPRLVGHAHAMDLILTGRGVSGEEARSMGLANRIVEPGEAVGAAIALAHELSALPQMCMRADRRSAYEQWSMALDDAILNELRLGSGVIASGETLAGASRFASGAGRHGTPASGI